MDAFLNGWSREQAEAFAQLDAALVELAKPLPRSQILPKAVMRNGDWTTEDYILTRTETGITDRPANKG